jgi:hypothetical protein
VVVIVADTRLKTSRRSGRLNAADEAFSHEQGERVVDGLQRNRANAGADDVGNGVSGDMGLARDGAQDGESLGGDLDTAGTKQRRRVAEHE